MINVFTDRITLPKKFSDTIKCYHRKKKGFNVYHLYIFLYMLVHLELRSLGSIKYN